MMPGYDRISCNGMAFDCDVGFHDVERGIKQKIILEYIADVRPVDAGIKDQPEGIRLDYYKAHHLLNDFFAKKRFNLIETIASEVADLLMKNFDVTSIRVDVTKSPIDVPIPSVTYSCSRSR